MNHETPRDEAASAPSRFALDAPTFARLHPAEYLRRFLAKNVRPDGRPYAPALRTAKFRKTMVNVGSISTSEGSATVRLGKTTVLCGIKAEVAAPPIDSPDNGYLVPNVELPPMSSPNFRPGAPSELAQTLSWRLEQLFRNCPTILDLKQLSIEEGAAAWVLYADIVCLNYDGNVFDATVIAIMAALKDVRLPKATYREEEGAVTIPDLSERPVRLQVGPVPVATTIGVFESQYFLVDPTEMETSLCSATLTLITDEGGRLLGLHKSGGFALNQEQMAESVETAIARGIEIRNQI
ncbi:exosome complex exonuclease RRP43-like protein [Gonapodya prolifera JEL478]|uniref:Ribosomal RNA-processing protein 43 n=1 Tax=Gonapodya prolifera (strain JEL478) TaxID=1344416 RepID=A0A139A9W7_GONPJ|nr:exosome complex exonuclease RRP43-like protein [Gonapodya prolifera JEL478]|eukprot:KXS13479.1 exosome complex exonuclease RRP43-like protein [Gonapodya prolifera JEL478]